jgi:predicted nuclease of predicted toxin-antitoxin system
VKLLIDECLPRRLKFTLVGHECMTVREAGFAGKENGELLSLAEGIFDVLITIDRNIRYQQNVTGRNISILIIRAKTNDLSDIQPQIPDVLVALKTVQPGQIVEVG